MRYGCAALIYVLSLLPLTVILLIMSAHLRDWQMS